jgi:molecular chaperone GrpE
LAKKHSKKKKHEDAPEETRADGTVDTETADAAVLEERIAELEKDLEAARDEARDAGDRALRTLAEFDNYRKRSRRENEDAMGAGAARVLGDLLQLADDLDRALEHAGADVPAQFLDGIRLVARGVSDLLDRHGVARIPAAGESFDPRVHEAISSVPAADGAAPNTVLHEVQPGYVQGDRVLRPARVVVTRAPEPPPAEEAGAAGGAPPAADSAPGDEESGDAA